MIEEAIAYVEYLSNSVSLEYPEMPKFDESAYNDNEYKLAISELENSMQIDDMDSTLRYLLGE